MTSEADVAIRVPPRRHKKRAEIKQMFSKAQLTALGHLPAGSLPPGSLPPARLPPGRLPPSMGLQLTPIRASTPGSDALTPSTGRKQQAAPGAQSAAGRKKLALIMTVCILVGAAIAVSIALAVHFGRNHSRWAGRARRNVTAPPHSGNGSDHTGDYRQQHSSCGDRLDNAT